MTRTRTMAGDEVDGGSVVVVEVELRATRLCHRVPGFGLLGGDGTRWRLGRAETQVLHPAKSSTRLWS